MRLPRRNDRPLQALVLLPRAAHHPHAHHPWFVILLLRLSWGKGCVSRVLPIRVRGVSCTRSRPNLTRPLAVTIPGPLGVRRSEREWNSSELGHFSVSRVGVPLPRGIRLAGEEWRRGSEEEGVLGSVGVDGGRPERMGEVAPSCDGECGHVQHLHQGGRGTRGHEGRSRRAAKGACIGSRPALFLSRSYRAEGLASLGVALKTQASCPGLELRELRTASSAAMELLNSNI